MTEECAETTSNNCAIKDAASATYTPVADDITDTLTVVATYTDGSHSPDVNDGKDVVEESAANMVLADTRNKAPVSLTRTMRWRGTRRTRSGVS